MLKVAIILCTYNPSLNFLRAQLKSIKNQSFTDFHLYVNDDCSTPSSFKVIEDCLRSIIKNNYTLSKNQENLGFAQNFIQTLNKIPNFDYYCFSDQDDDWHKNKISRAIKKLNNYDLYCSSTLITDKSSHIRGLNKLNVKPSFKHSLVQSIAGGNTYIFNHDVRLLMKIINPKFTIPSHDWLIYQIATSCGKSVYYDRKPFINYRLHDKNTIGTSFSLLAKLARFRALLSGQFRLWNNNNLIALKAFESQMTKSNKIIFNIFSLKRNGMIFDRLSLLFFHGIKRSNLYQNIALFLALLLKKI